MFSVLLFSVFKEFRSFFSNIGKRFCRKENTGSLFLKKPFVVICHCNRRSRLRSQHHVVRVLTTIVKKATDHPETLYSAVELSIWARQYERILTKRPKSAHLKNYVPLVIKVSEV